MKSTRLFICLMIMGFAVSAGAEDELAARGKTLVEGKRCDACHREGGLAAALKGLGNGKTDEQLKEIMTNPKKVFGPTTMMPTYQFTDEEMEAVIDYLRSLSKS
jgi:mono/diheme cytochrome c family protein